MAFHLLKSTNLFTNNNQVEQCSQLKHLCKSLRITWIDLSGTVIFDNDFLVAQLSNHSECEEIITALKSGEGQAVRYSSTLNEDTFYYAVCLDNGTILRLATEAKSLGSIILSATPIITLVLLLIILACIALSHMLTSQLIKSD